MSTPAAILSSGKRRPPNVLIASVLLLTSVVAGLALEIKPFLGLVPIAALASALLLVSGRARILFVLFGGLFILQSEQSLDKSKMAFLAVFSVAFLGAYLNTRRMYQTPAYRLARPLLTASTALVALIGLSLAVAHAFQTPLVGAWLRDAAPYLLFASAPIFALDAQASLSKRQLVALLVAAGAIGAIAFAVYWLHRRGIANLQASRIGLASHFVPAALFAYAMSATLQARRTRWLILAASVFALLLVTGTRTTLVLVVAPIFIALGARRYRASRSVRLALIGPVAIAVTLGLGFAVVRASGGNEANLSKRISILKSTGGETDASYNERLQQTRVAWDTFKAHPVVGHGPGTAFEWQTQNRIDVSSFLLDTPLTLPAKFGIAGLGVLALVIAKYWSFCKALSRRREPGIAYLALLGYLAVVVASVPGSSPFEDKGFSFGLILVLALALHEAGGASPQPPEDLPGTDPVGPTR
jgi:O-antigen ligase